MNVNIFHAKRKAKRHVTCHVCCSEFVLPSLHDVKVDASSSDLCSKGNIQNVHGLCQSHSIVYFFWLLYPDVNVHVALLCVLSQ